APITRRGAKGSKTVSTAWALVTGAFEIGGRGPAAEVHHRRVAAGTVRRGFGVIRGSAGDLSKGGGAGHRAVVGHLCLCLRMPACGPRDTSPKLDESSSHGSADLSTEPLIARGVAAKREGAYAGDSFQ